MPDRDEDRLLKLVPPHSIEAESSVLGAILIDQDALDLVAGAGLRAEHFFAAGRGAIYGALLALRARGAAIDVLLLKQELEREGLLEGVGGATALAEILDAVPNSSNAAHYAEIVRHCAAARTLIRAGHQIAKVALEGGEATTAELIDRSEQLLFAATQQRATTRATPVGELPFFEREQARGTRDLTVSAERLANVARYVRALEAKGPDPVAQRIAFVALKRRLEAWISAGQIKTLEADPTDVVQAFQQLREAAGDAWDHVDMRDVRGGA